MDTDEQRTILEAIARDEDNYPRDRIAAVKALRDMAENEGADLDKELAGLIDKHK